MSITKTQLKIFTELETFIKEKLGKAFFGGVDIYAEKIGQYSIEPFKINRDMRMRIRLLQRVEDLGKPEERFGNSYKTIITTLLNKEGVEEIKQLIKTICQ
jgi:hypothetical protein